MHVTSEIGSFKLSCSADRSFFLPYAIVIQGILHLSQPFCFAGRLFLQVSVSTCIKSNIADIKVADDGTSS